MLDPGTIALTNEPQAAGSLLAVLRGYLKGCVEELTYEAQMKANAEAYAEYKVRSEKGYL